MEMYEYFHFITIIPKVLSQIIWALKTYPRENNDQEIGKQECHYLLKIAIFRAIRLKVNKSISSHPTVVLPHKEKYNAEVSQYSLGCM